jgi:WASH complex subunit 7
MVKDYSAKEDYAGFFPYERAQHIYAQIKSWLSLKKTPIILINLEKLSPGNSLGFIRLVRSASLHTESKNIEYLPNRADIDETF